jgi:hypothetical protein
MLVFMLIIGKILGESLIFLTMKESNVLNGRQSTSFKLMQMAVKMSIGANFLTVGKSKNIIHLTIRFMLADKDSSVRSLTVLTTTVRQIEGTQLVLNSDYSPEIVAAPQVAAIMLFTNYTSLCS